LAVAFRGSILADVPAASERTVGNVHLTPLASRFLERVWHVSILAVRSYLGRLTALAARWSLAQEKPKAYPIKLEADDVHEIAELSIETNGLTVTAKNVVAVPIRCEVGVTGAIILGAGEYRFSPADGDEVQGEFRAAMLRFNPDDQAKFLPLDKAKVTTDHAAHEMSRHLLNNIFRHCWHSGMDALIPDRGTLAANVYSKTHGDLLMSTGPKASVAHSFTTGQTMYPKK
jgi:hypothetical protein